MLSKCWEEAAQDGEGAAGRACTRLSTGDSAIPRSWNPAAENTGPDPVKAAQVTNCYSPQLFLSLRLLAMADCGLVWQGAVNALVVFSRALRVSGSLRGSVPVLGAVRSDSEDVAVALVGRTGEEKGGES